MKHKKNAREILVDKNLIENKNITVRIGTVENRNSPNTIYLYMSFWIKPKNQSESPSFYRKNLSKELKSIYSGQLKSILIDNKMFPSERENIYICNIPDNFNYNDKSNFVSIELYLHTCNIHNEEKMPLNNRKDTEMFMNVINISNEIGNCDIIKGKKLFDIFKTSAMS